MMGTAATYVIYQGHREGVTSLVALQEGVLGTVDLDGHKTEAADYFLPRTEDVRQVGVIEVAGDAHWLGDHFDL